MRAAIVTGIYGGFDDPKPVKPQTCETEWVLVTDSDREVDGWTVVSDPKPVMQPRTAAKIPKLFPWRYVDADWYIWIDGAFEVTSPFFVQEAILALEGHDLAQFAHPDRGCLFDEAHISQGIDKYRQGDIAGQVETYREAGMPEQWGLWATGLIVRRPTDAVKAHSQGWWDQILRWSYQDQVSEPFTSWALDLRPHTLPHPLWSNPWLRWHGHPRGD